MLYWRQEKEREVSAMQLDLRHVAEQNAKRYRENLSYLRGYEAAADADRPLSPRYVEKAGWVWAVERVRADLLLAAVQAGVLRPF